MWCLTWELDFVVIAVVLSVTYMAFILASKYQELLSKMVSKAHVVVRYARHQWDIPACWFDARFMKVRGGIKVCGQIH